MTASQHIRVEPNTSEAIQMAYSRGLIEYGTMVDKLKNLSQFFCDGCRQYLPNDQRGRCFQDGPDYCEICSSKD